MAKNMVGGPTLKIQAVNMGSLKKSFGNCNKIKWL